MKPNAMDRFINAIELVAAAFVGLVAADVFISVLLRYFFSIDIPDSYNFGQLLLHTLEKRRLRLNSFFNQKAGSLSAITKNSGRYKLIDFLLSRRRNFYCYHVIILG